jgi:putative oxidoreductase
MDLLPSANTPRPAQINAALLILRVASALAFLYHGSGILFGAFGGPGPQKFSALMHLPVVVGYLVGLAQVAGGLAILSGVLIRLGAACIIVVMLGAIFLVHLPGGFDVGVSMLQRRRTPLVAAERELRPTAGGVCISVLALTRSAP